MYLPLGKFSPDVKIGFVSASRNCFPRSLAEERSKRLLAAIKKTGIKVVVPKGDCWIVETRAHAHEAAKQLVQAGCHGAVLYLGNFSPEIEDAAFVKAFNAPTMVLAAAEEAATTLASKRGDALCGLLSCMLDIRKRGKNSLVHLPEHPVVNAVEGAREVQHFAKVLKVYVGASNATIGLFGPRPRDFETVNYNMASLASIGVEVEELALVDVANMVETIKASGNVSSIIKKMKEEVGSAYGEDFMKRLAVYEKALLHFRDTLKLSGMASQCWPEQEPRFGHVPCYINARLAARGCPVACENDAYSLVAELMGQYATDSDVTILDINHSIPKDLGAQIKGLPNEDLVGFFHCGNTNVKRMKKPAMKYQVIMKRLMEPSGQPDITRGTIEGQIAASPCTVLQVHGVGDALRAYIIEGEFLDIDPKTFGATGTAYLPGFSRFYRHTLLSRFHHHAAIAFNHCGAVLFDAMKLLGIKEVFTPNPEHIPYQGENVFRTAIYKK